MCVSEEVPQAMGKNEVRVLKRLLSTEEIFLLSLNDFSFCEDFKVEDTVPPTTSTAPSSVSAGCCFPGGRGPGGGDGEAGGGSITQHLLPEPSSHRRSGK